MNLLKAIQQFLTLPPSEADRLRAALANVHELHAEQLLESDAVWRKEVAELMNTHHRERRAWDKEKKRLIELEQRARTALDNTQALMTPHLSGKTRVSSVGNFRIQLDSPARSRIDPYMLLSAFAQLVIDSNVMIHSSDYPGTLSELLAKTPPLHTKPAKPAPTDAELSDEMFRKLYATGKRMELAQKGLSTPPRILSISPGPGVGQ